MYITKPAHVYKLPIDNANTRNAANGITPTTSGGVKPSLFWFFILDIPELRNIESSIDNHAILMVMIQILLHDKICALQNYIMMFQQYIMVQMH